MKGNEMQRETKEISVEQLHYCSAVPSCTNDGDCILHSKRRDSILKPTTRNKLPIANLKLRGGMPNVGMDNWTSDFDRMCWNESNPDILSPLFVPKVPEITF
jgi:hypothetical protein